ncbi:MULTISPECIES: LysR family transcriptional regulator [Brevibacterium]|uniref:LysR family transcriptional regulator n=1 Tax=Brevibacterium salitolerans TaxID=1403566 RepID=A0ABN2WWZ9_9MICO|nr:LysR family transcriptional regulator [Brevibacterium sp.]
MWDLRRLRAWRAVVASGSVQGAARNLNFSPAAVSQQIIALQREVGIPLYERRGRGLEPTAAGLRLAEESAELFAGARRLDSVVEDLRGDPAPHLAIGCFSSAAREWMPTVVREVRAGFPDMRFEVSVNEPFPGPGRRPSDIEIHNEVPAEGRVRLRGYRRSASADDPCVVVMGEAHPLAAEAVLPMRALGEEPWVDHDIYDSPTGRVIAQATRAAGFEPRHLARSDDHDAVLAMVRAGIGVTVLPALAARSLPDGLRAVPLENPTPVRRVVLQIREAAEHRPFVAAAEEAIRTVAGMTAVRTGS